MNKYPNLNAEEKEKKNIQELYDSIEIIEEEKIGVDLKKSEPEKIEKENKIPEKVKFFEKINLL